MSSLQFMFSTRCIFLACLLVGIASSADREITVNPGGDNEIIYENAFNAVSYSPMESDTPPFIVHSDIPTSLLLYRANELIDGNDAVIINNEVRLYIKTNCPDEFVDLNVTTEKDKYGSITEIKITSSHHAPPTLLPNSKFQAVWNFTLPWCAKNVEESKKNTGLRKRSKVNLDNTIATIFEDEESEMEHPLEFCEALVEILYDGCYRTFQTDAPIISVSDAYFGGITSMRQNDECTIYSEGAITISNTTVYVDTDTDHTTILTEKLGRSECMRIAPGRPYFDSSKKQLQAKAVTDSEACWSTPMEDNRKDFESIESHSKFKQQTKEMASSWIERSIGEHASIASFAAFTISLMTNNAPPDLIRDALLAALDELDHATTSFEMASLLSGETIEPGPLPSSNHDFGNDIGALMVSTFKEGCVDETLSALAAAAEAESYSLCEVDDENDCMMERLLEEKLSKIALDEARHSALAWRTVEWACGVDEVSCDDLLKNHKLDESGLLDAAKLSFPSLHGAFDLEWRKIHEVLFDFVTGSKNDVAYDCESDGDVTGLSNRERSVVKEVSKMVIGEVMCGFGRMESSEEVVLASS